MKYRSSRVAPLSRLALLGLLFALSGCVSAGNRKSLFIDPHGMSLGAGNYGLRSLKPVVGTSASIIILGITLDPPSVGEAIDDALGKGGGDVILGLRVYQGGYSAFLFGREEITVMGFPIDYWKVDPNIPSAKGREEP